MKVKIRTIIWLLLSYCACLNAYAQDAVNSFDSTHKVLLHTVTLKPKGPKPITHEMSVGFRLNSDGWSAYTDIGRVKTNDPRHGDMFYNVRFWQIEITEKKSPDEYKTTSDNGGGNNTYIYGKINNFYAVKLGWGYRKMLAGKPDPGSVSIHWVNAGGVSIGILKPYYINTLSDPSAIRYADPNKSDFLDQNNIEGSAGFSKGLNQITVVPGFHFKSALHFDFSTNRKNVIGVETGFNIEYYTTQVQLMATQSPTSYFLDLFIAAQFGRRW